MDPRLKKLTGAELEIMAILWNARAPLTSKDVQAALKEKRDWQLSTVMAAMEKLARSGFIAIDRATRTNYYTAHTSENTYKAYEGQSVLQKFFDSSLKNLVTNLYSENALSGNDLAELEQYIKGLKHQPPQGGAGEAHLPG